MASTTPTFISKIGHDPSFQLSVNSSLGHELPKKNVNISSGPVNTPPSTSSLAPIIPISKDSAVNSFESLVTHFDLLDSRTKTVLNNITLLKSKLIFETNSFSSSFDQKSPSITLAETTLKAIISDFEAITENYHKWRASHSNNAPEHNNILSAKHQKVQGSIKTTEGCLSESKSMLNQQLSTGSISGYANAGSHLISGSDADKHPSHTSRLHEHQKPRIMTPSSTMSLQPSLAQLQLEQKGPAVSLTGASQSILRRLSGSDVIPMVGSDGGPTLGGDSYITSGTPSEGHTGTDFQIPPQPVHSTRSLTSTRDPRGMTDIGQLELLALQNTNHYVVPPQTTRHFEMSPQRQTGSMESILPPSSTRSMLDQKRPHRTTENDQDEEDGLTHHDFFQNDDMSVTGGAVVQRKITGNASYNPNEDLHTADETHPLLNMDDRSSSFVSDYYPVKTQSTIAGRVKQCVTLYALRYVLVLGIVAGVSLLLYVGHGVITADHDVFSVLNFLHSKQSSPPLNTALFDSLSPFSSHIEVNPIHPPPPITNKHHQTPPHRGPPHRDVRASQEPFSIRQEPSIQDVPVYHPYAGSAHGEELSEPVRIPTNHGLERNKDRTIDDPHPSTTQGELADTTPPAQGLPSVKQSVHEHTGDSPNDQISEATMASQNTPVVHSKHAEEEIPAEQLDQRTDTKSSTAGDASNGLASTPQESSTGHDVADNTDNDNGDDGYGDILSDDDGSDTPGVEIPVAYASGNPEQRGNYPPSSSHASYNNQYYNSHALQQRQAQQYQESVRHHQEALARQQQMAQAQFNQQQQQQQYRGYHTNSHHYNPNHYQYHHGHGEHSASRVSQYASQYLSPQQGSGHASPYVHQQPSVSGQYGAQYYPQQPSQTQLSYVRPVAQRPPMYQYRYKTEL